LFLTAGSEVCKRDV